MDNSESYMMQPRLQDLPATTSAQLPAAQAKGGQAKKGNSKSAAQMQDQAPPRLPKGFDSANQHNTNTKKSKSNSAADRTPFGRMGAAQYEFDSCISTEEAFFGLDDGAGANTRQHHSGAGVGAIKHPSTNNGSNPQEDSTPKARRLANRRTVESFQRKLGGVITGASFMQSRHRTQRLSPKGQKLARQRSFVEPKRQGETGPGPGESSSGGQQAEKQNFNRNQSVKLLKLDRRRRADDSPASENVQVLSELVAPQARQSVSKLKVLQRQNSYKQVKGFKDATPLMQDPSYTGSGCLIEAYSSDLGERKSSFLRRSVTSRHSARSNSEEPATKLNVNRSRRPLESGTRAGSGVAGGLNSGNVAQSPLTSKQKGSNLSGRRDSFNVPAINTESQRVIGGITQPIVGHSGQASMKIDMKFGWRPGFTEKDKLHNREAIAIKLSYPPNRNPIQTSIRNSQLFSDIYRQNKNYRALRNEYKKRFVADFRSKVVYTGYRPSVSLELHLRYGQKAGFNEDSVFYDVLIPKKIKATAFEGGTSRPTPRCQVEGAETPNESSLNQQQTDCDLTFDSTFESGNLDLAIQVQPSEFNLYLKPDTNTKGYCNWFFFKVKRRPEAHGKPFPRCKFQFNIMNMYKKKILYRQDAKPLACFQEIHHKGFIMQDLEVVSWKTSCFSNVGYGQVNANQVAPNSSAGLEITQVNPAPQQSPHDLRNNLTHSSMQVLREQTLIPTEQSGAAKNKRAFCLTFDFEFSAGQEFAYIASSIPYPYTFLQKTIKTCVRLDQSMTTLTRSLGGLLIPMLTITNEVVNISKKRTVIICGRIHPGETNSSWVLHGIIDFLISRDASHLRDSLVFKIVPMVNPDGVVAGNYRTSFIGKDLNRLYLQGSSAGGGASDSGEARYGKMDDILKPEITAMKQLIKSCKNDGSKGILAFIDVHHHSQKRGAFMFGPSYQMQHSKYQEVRVLPKLISMLLPDVFRFQSCRFKNQSYKENCARLFCDREAGITYSFCLECSQQGYFTQVTDTANDRGQVPAHSRQVKYFNQNSLMHLGRKVCEATHMLHEMSEVQDQKRDEIQRRRRQRLIKKGKKGAKSVATKRKGAGGADQSSMNGATDFDLESDYYRNQSSAYSHHSSQDFYGGATGPGSGFNTKIGIKGFIAQMMTSKPKGAGSSSSSQLLKQDGSRGALRQKSLRPLTHFGSEDAVSEKSEKEEESMSGSDGGSSQQDLSENEQDKVLDQVLDQLMPNRCKKMDQVSAQITINKKPEPPLPMKPLRRNLRSANRIVPIDKRLVQKEQLLIPKAAPNLQIGFNQPELDGMTSQGVQQLLLGEQSNKVPRPEFENESKSYHVAGPGKKDQIKVSAVAESLSAVTPLLPKKRPLNNPVQTAGATHGYVSHRTKLSKQKRVMSSRQARGSQGAGKTSMDMFANTGYMAPGLDRKQTAKLGSSVKYTNIYSMVQHSAPKNPASPETTNVYGQRPSPRAGGNAKSPDHLGQQLAKYQQHASQQQQTFGNQTTNQSPLGVRQPDQNIVNRSSLRTAGALQQSFGVAQIDESVLGMMTGSTALQANFSVATAANVQMVQSQASSQPDSPQILLPVQKRGSGSNQLSNEVSLQVPSRKTSATTKQEKSGLGVKKQAQSVAVTPAKRDNSKPSYQQQSQSQSKQLVIKKSQISTSPVTKMMGRTGGHPPPVANIVIKQTSKRQPSVSGLYDQLPGTGQQTRTILFQSQSFIPPANQIDQKPQVDVSPTMVIPTARELSFSPIQATAAESVDRTHIPLSQGGFFHRKQLKGNDARTLGQPILAQTPDKRLKSGSQRIGGAMAPGSPDIAVRWAAKNGSSTATGIRHQRPPLNNQKLGAGQAGPTDGRDLLRGLDQQWQGTVGGHGSSRTHKKRHSYQLSSQNPTQLQRGHIEPSRIISSDHVMLSNFIQHSNQDTQQPHQDPQVNTSLAPTGSFFRPVPTSGLLAPSAPGSGSGSVAEARGGGEGTLGQRLSHQLVEQRPLSRTVQKKQAQSMLHSNPTFGSGSAMAGGGTVVIKPGSRLARRYEENAGRLFGEQSSGALQPAQSSRSPTKRPQSLRAQIFSKTKHLNRISHPSSQAEQNPL